MMESRIYDLYKPLRNHLRLSSVENAFYVIWAYINYFQFSKQMPRDIQVDMGLMGKTMPGRAIFEWELSLLAREMIINGQKDLSFRKKDFREWGYFRDAVNKLKNFENQSAAIIINNSNILKELNRIARRQFPWQFRIDPSLFIRYYKIFSNSRVVKIIEEKVGLTIQQWYMIGTVLLGAVLDNPKFTNDLKIEIDGLTKKDFYNFISLTSTNLEKMAKIIETDVKYDDRFAYSFNPLEYYPLVQINNFYYCPVTPFLAWRITSGIYFDLIKGDNSGEFGRCFGLSFQDYLEEVAKKVIDRDNIIIIPEKKYRIGTKTDQDSIDLIISQKDAALFIEAKAKRLSVKSKSELISDDAIEKDLDILADEIIKMYLTIDDYLKGAYSHFPFDKNIEIYPILITLEDWFILGEDAKNLRIKVEKKLLEKQLSEEFLSRMPYSVCATQNFEALSQLLNNHSIKEIMNQWFSPGKMDHNFGNFLVTQYSGEYKSIDEYFPGEFEKIYKIKNG